MKLKRLLSALIVFTLVMTSVMCSVSAAGTYQAVTKYNTDGTVSVTAKIADANAGDYVSYIIYGDDVKNDVEEDVSEGNIKYINQGTVDTDGVVDFKTVKFDYADIINRNIKFATNGDVLTPNVAVKNLKDYKGAENGASVEQVLDTNLEARLYLLSIGNQFGSNSTVSRVTVSELVGDTLTTKGLAYKNYVAINPNATAITFDFNGYAEERIACNTFTLERIAGASHNGAAKSSLTLNYNFANDFINNRIKLVADENGKFTDGTKSLDIESGDFIVINGTSGKGTETDSSTKFFTVDAIPYENVETVDGVDYDAVTFLVSGTEKMLSSASQWGIDVYVYDADKLNPESATGTTFDNIEPVKVYENLYDLSNSEKFAIQLVNVAGDEYFNNDEYVFEAVPFYVVNGEKFQCTSYGGNYFVPNRITVVGEVK